MTLAGLDGSVNDFESLVTLLRPLRSDISRPDPSVRASHTVPLIDVTATLRAFKFFLNY